jgi:uncharacterized protein (TIGR02680 family)
MSSQWHMNRAGFVNYWNFGETIYEFAQGRLLLRGSNGSGKSISTVSILPLLLDGNTSARRLDPFGSADRKIENYLLGEPGVDEKEDETGYLFLEYKKGNEDRYITTGMGIRARKGGPTEKWYFVITDNRRVAIDFDLQLERGINERQPLSRLQLVNAIGEGGMVFKRAVEYAATVNRLIFGFDSIEAYQDMIQLMIDLRSPKLSKDFAPSVIYKILEDSLPPISDQALSTISRSLEDLDDAKVRLDSARHDVERLEQVEALYNRYNESVAARLASKYLEYDGVATSSEEKKVRFSENLKQLEMERKGIEDVLVELKQEKNILNEENLRLMRHEVHALQEKKDDLIKRQMSLNSNKKKFESHLNSKQDQYNKQKLSLLQLENDIYQQEKESKNYLLELSNISDGLFFENEHNEFAINEIYNFRSWRNRVNYLKDELNKVRNSLSRIGEINKEIAVLDKRVSDINEQISQAEILKKQKQLEFTTMIGFIESDFNTWKKDIVFDISNEAWNETYARLQSLEDSEDYFGRITEPVRNAYNQFVLQKEGEIARNQVKLDNLSNVEKELTTELRSWKNHRLPVPPRSLEAEQERQDLKDEGIEFRSFYELIEFRDTTDETIRRNIESAMMTTGLLDGIVANETLELKHNGQLKPQNVLMSETLETYLKPTINNTAISIDKVRALLGSIVVDYSDHESVSISPNGSYHLGILEGASQSVKKACFIGKEAQENFRIQRIDELECELIEWESNNLYHQDIETKLREMIQVGAKSLDKMPDDSELIILNNEISACNREISLQKQSKQLYENQKLNLLKQRSATSEIVKLFETRFETQINLDSIVLEINGIRDYESILLDLENTTRGTDESKKRSKMVEDAIESSEVDLDYLNYELKETQIELDKNIASVESIDVQLKLQGAQEISDKISANKQRIEVIELEINNYQSRILVKVDTEINSTNESLHKATRDFDFYKQLSQAWWSSFEKNHTQYQRSTTTVDTLELIKEYAKKHRANASDLETRRTNDLKSYLRDNQYELSNYGPELITEEAPRFEEWMRNVDSEYKLNIELWAKDQQREVLSCLDDSNKRTTLFAVIDSLRLYVSEQEVYISEEDRKLFEDILYNSVGQDLRRLIDNAETWAVKMNSVLSAQDNYRGLKFYIEWRPNRAQQDDEMHTSELVELLRKPAEMMNEADLEKMTGHFRARVDQAKIMMEKNESMQTLHDVMKFVLDYRNWFSFRINYEKDLESKRELTNKYFNKFSSGEKAIAMYLPLFTAIYARYDDAAFESPRIIALDEAFAGIDEANIAELFKAMDDLGFDYILNSQALWGDYETVKQLNIYQLIRERGSNIVVNIPFYWNGTFRREVNHE